MGISDISLFIKHARDDSINHYLKYVMLVKVSKVQIYLGWWLCLWYEDNMRMMFNVALFVKEF